MSDARAMGRFAEMRLLARGWWLMLLRGLAGILFGLVALLLPGIGLALILGFLAAFLAIDGVSSITQAVRGGAGHSRTWLWVDGVASLAAAVAILLLPAVSALLLVVMLGAWSMVVGVIRLVLAFRSGSILMGLLGALAVLVGGWMIASPGLGLLALIWLVAAQAILAGGMFIALGWRLRRVAQDPHGPDATPQRG
ncbi:HdeD family acid-resistance protein [Falsiroseomonas selenitidurans]|uniref:HdeD family acid-resistance protein n=1 Tax=Falsiroseomonas selenitidurans TaxID=2716335 RepID=A0ABX1E172_9PROT|nr:DUF308 domain-containing protein [Falsiroseomonas selenitidurans]NKC30523.1 HdeD family acid-resistance protein [Falsiroseomonas selenitidurans]